MIKSFSLFESNLIKLPNGCRQVTYREFVNDIVEQESRLKSSDDDSYHPFEKFSNNEINKLKKVVSRFDGHFSILNNDSAAFLHTVFDPRI